MKKPPTQVAGVQGFSAFEAKPTPRTFIDWYRLCGLPPFQMYAVERSGKSPSNQQDWMNDWLQSHDDPLRLYDDYCQWHRSKGYWPNETPMGEVEQV
ncbi:hypothetical protein vBPaeMUSP25_22 [Pseudomonas phage vB_PaeM_USP_25]|nr:hypothetical protein vBPaeMUSP25_22 [Pseudomonas phage vB_PaeM_USP_25]